MVVEKRKSTGEIQVREEMETGIRQHREAFQVIEFTTTTDPSLPQMRRVDKKGKTLLQRLDKVRWETTRDSTAPHLLLAFLGLVDISIRSQAVGEEWERRRSSSPRE